MGQPQLLLELMTLADVPEMRTLHPYNITSQYIPRRRKEEINALPIKTFRASPEHKDICFTQIHPY